VDLPVSASDRTAQLGYEYDSYEKAPEPQHLTTRRRPPPDSAPTSLSTSAPWAVPSGAQHASIASGGKQQMILKALDQHQFRWQRRTETHRARWSP
jgi:hypothetical protein